MRGGKWEVVNTAVCSRGRGVLVLGAESRWMTCTCTQYVLIRPRGGVGWDMGLVDVPWCRRSLVARFGAECFGRVGLRGWVAVLSIAAGPTPRADI